jgi:alkanesulfonate monooxygenase SsuD/methylene tetrahydromethanopterin reductase-like flavin-dependent oxidoreductase (luciferase family)
VRFGLWYDFRNPSGSGRSSTDLYGQTLDQIVYAEELGFDDVWLSEHHFVDDGYLPSCLPVAAAIAARTSRVTIGTNVLLLPFHHPIRLAEDCAVVDIISNGRLIFGPAVGYRLDEFTTFGVDRRRRGSITEEAVEIMVRCWTDDDFSYHGQHFHFDNVRCTPKPVQRPIPVWFGATQGEAIRRAARLGNGLLGGGPGARKQYLAALADYGKTERDAHIASGGRFLFCSAEPERDWEILRPHALYQLQNYARWFKAAGQPIFGDPPVDEADLEARGAYLCGTPEQIIHATRAAHEQAPFERHFFWAIWPGVDPAMATRSIELFAHEVIPHLRDL